MCKLRTYKYYKHLHNIRDFKKTLHMEANWPFAVSSFIRRSIRFFYCLSETQIQTPFLNFEPYLYQFNFQKNKARADPP